jgi:hypothetical protein
VWRFGKIGQGKYAKAWAVKDGFIHVKAMGNLKVFLTFGVLEDFNRTTCTVKLWKSFQLCWHI